MILSQKPMDRTNYNQWKTNLYIVLDYEKLKFVLTTPKPNESTIDVFEETKMQYLEWQKANTVAHCYILTIVAGHLQKQIYKLKSGTEMIQTLDGMFAKSSSVARQDAVRALMNTHVTEDSVWDHCHIMMSHLSRAKVMGAKREEEMQIDIILESLPNIFN